MNEASFSLLTQNEIDTLIKFLSQKDEGVTRDVLSQNSIDKLIHLIRNNDINKVRLDTLDALEIKPTYDILKELNLRDDPTEVCELSYKLDEGSNYICLYARNTVTGRELPITPMTLDRTELISGETFWGYSIAPILFDKIAKIFTLKYSRQTYDEICALYSEKNFGSSTQKLPSLYYPASNQLLDNLL